MRKGEIKILRELQQKPANITELAEELEMSRSWVSELVSNLEEHHLVEKNGKITLSDSYEARMLERLIEKYDLNKILMGKKEEILTVLIDEPKTIEKIGEQGFATSTIYKALNSLQEASVVEKKNSKFVLRDEDLARFLQARYGNSSNTIKAKEGTIKSVSSQKENKGKKTAFSAFQRYGVDYLPSKDYIYQGNREIGVPDVLIHAVALAENKKQMAMCGIFYLKHRKSLDIDNLWRLANNWNCVEKWADLLAFIDQREVRNNELFLPWEEFLSLARDYNVYPRNKYPGNTLEQGLKELGNALEKETDIYLLGGGNLILRGLKDTTKDIDIVLDDEESYQRLVKSLINLGYGEKKNLDEAYENLEASIILDKDHSPRWDVFLKIVADSLHLTPGMKTRSDKKKKYGNLRVHLLNLTDIFLFKAITEREGDLEDCALIVRQENIDWKTLMKEIKEQEKRTEKYFSFAVLDTFDLLMDRYDIKIPIQEQLASYCLENALFLTLEKPKTINDLREELDFPDHQIYNKLRKLEEENKVRVDRSGKLNRYQKA